MNKFFSLICMSILAAPALLAADEKPAPIALKNKSKDEPAPIELKNKSTEEPPPIALKNKSSFNTLIPERGVHFGRLRGNQLEKLRQAEPTKVKFHLAHFSSLPSRSMAPRVSRSSMASPCRKVSNSASKSALKFTRLRSRELKMAG